MTSGIDFHDNVNFGNYEDGDGSEDEDDRSDEIRQLVSNALENETFDDESEKSFALDQHMHGNGHITDSPEFPGLPLPKNTRTTLNGFGNNGYGDYNGLNSFQYPDMSKVQSETGTAFGSKNSSNGSVNVNGLSKKVRFEKLTESTNGYVPPIVNGKQTDRGDEEIVANNPTISLMHQMHCPQTHPGGGDAWIGNDRQKLENLTALLELRDKQIKKMEEDADSYSKDKRSLNHQVGLLKTEMAHMRSTQEDLQKVIELRDEEIRYLKTQLTSAVQEYENVTHREKLAKDEANSYADENERLKLQIQQLSSIGTSTQQAEVDSVVRQVREKHARDIAYWQTKFADLQSELQIYKRGQHNSMNESMVIEKQDAFVQTEKIKEREKQEAYVQTEKIKELEKPKELVKVVLKQDFGQTTNLPAHCAHTTSTSETTTANTGKSVSPAVLSPSISRIDTDVFEKWKQALAKSEDDKHRLVEFYEQEIEEYKTKLALLPTELFNVWTQQQEELGLGSFHSAHLSTEQHVGENEIPIKKGVDVFAQTDVSSNAHECPHTTVSGQGHGQSLDSIASSADVLLSAPNPVDSTSTSVKEVSSVVIQTEETLETFDVLGEVIQEWAQEVLVSGQRAEEAEKEVAAVIRKLKETEIQLKEIDRKYRRLADGVKQYEAKQKHKEENLKKQLIEQKEKFLSILTKVSSKLDIEVPMW